ncbi:MAG: FAD-dependent oxidoreductase [Ruminococcaceae bacterium]|nr:FAD-dependent oxidoreductase [Oscillospiraceae bacterium]
MNKSIITESLSTPVRYKCDVCVAGGGVAGIAASISAARAGRAVGRKTDVILLEKSFMLGGLATAGLVTIYLPICDGKGRQVCYGLTEELLRLSIEHGAEADYPTAWLENGSYDEKRKKRFFVQFNAQLFAISAERLLKEEGVHILYGASAAATTVKDGRITNIIIEGKGGREAIEIERAVIDTTGDADICKQSGAKTEIYRDGNKLAAWYYGYGMREHKLYMCGVHDTPDKEKNTDLKDEKRYSGLDTAELSEMVETAHAHIINNLLKRREDIPDLVPTTIGTIPQLRMTRRLVGKSTPDISEEYISYPDTVGIYPNWRKRGPVYELPLSALYGDEIENLLTAGRCISGTDAMWDITRVIPVCAVTGEAAGAAAAICGNMKNVNIEEIQSYLVSAKVLLRWEKENEQK